MENELTIAQIADALGVNTWTVYRWIEWYFSDLPKPEGLYLPPYRLKGVQKIFKESDIEHFKKFQVDLPFGAMKLYTSYRFKSGPKDPAVAEAIKHSRRNQRQQMIRKK